VLPYLKDIGTFSLHKILPIHYDEAGTASAFGFFSNTWMFGFSKINPVGVASPIAPAIGGRAEIRVK
jgi:hypothetical protein